jgi:hypothetical protein
MFVSPTAYFSTVVILSWADCERAVKAHLAIGSAIYFMIVGTAALFSMVLPVGSAQDSWGFLVFGAGVVCLVGILTGILSFYVLSGFAYLILRLNRIQGYDPWDVAGTVVAHVSVTSRAYFILPLYVLLQPAMLCYSLWGARVIADSLGRGIGSGTDA